MIEILPQDKYKFVICTGDIYYDIETGKFILSIKDLEDDYTKVIIL